LKEFRISGSDIKQSLKQKFRRAALNEAGVPNAKRERRLYHNVSKGFN